MALYTIGQSAVPFNPGGPVTLLNLGTANVYIDTVTPNVATSPYIAPLGGIELDGSDSYYLVSAPGQTNNIYSLAGMRSYLPSPQQQVEVSGPVNVSGSTVGLAPGTEVNLPAGTEVTLPSGQEVALATGTQVGLASGTTVGVSGGTIDTSGSTVSLSGKNLVYTNDTNAATSTTATTTAYNYLWGSTGSATEVIDIVGFYLNAYMATGGSSATASLVLSKVGTSVPLSGAKPIIELYVPAGMSENTGFITLPAPLILPLGSTANGLGYNVEVGLYIAAGAGPSASHCYVTGTMIGSVQTP